MASETEERTERAAPPRFSESESPPAWLIATRGDLREMEARVNYRIDDAKADIRTRIDDAKAETSAQIGATNTRIDDASATTNTRIDDAKAETSAQIGATNTRIDELKEDGRARDAKLDAMADALSRIEANQKSESRRKQLSAAWIGIAVGALGIAAGILWNLMG